MEFLVNDNKRSQYVRSDQTQTAPWPYSMHICKNIKVWFPDPRVGGKITSFDQLQERIRARTSEPNDNVTMTMGNKIAVDDTKHRHVVALIDMEAVT